MKAENVEKEQSIDFPHNRTQKYIFIFLQIIFSTAKQEK